MNDFTAEISEEFRLKTRPTVTVVAEIVRNSQEIDIYVNDINISLYSLKYSDDPEEYDADRKMLNRKVWDLERSNEDLVNK